MATEAPEDKVDFLTKAIELTKLLVSNKSKTRSYGINIIKQLFLKHSGDTIDALQLNDYLIIWKRLFYFIWMSDKSLQVPLQESDTENISKLIHSCTSYQGKILFINAFFLTIKDDWMSINQHCIDKFMMFVRRCLRQLLFTFVNCDWNLEYINSFSKVLYRALQSFTLQLRIRLQDIFLEELVEVCKGKVPFDALVIVLDSFLHSISKINDFTLIKEVSQNVSKRLLSQSPDLKIIETKFQTQNKMDKSSKLYNDLELVKNEISDENLNEKNGNTSDPGVGNVNVEIPQIKFNPKDIARVLNKYVTEVEYTKKCLLVITKLINHYNRLGDDILLYKQKNWKLNSQVLKEKNKNHLSKMVKEEVKKLGTVDSKIKKNGRKVNVHKSLKKSNNMSEIIVERGKSLWKVEKFDDVNILKDSLNLNRSWTVSEETKNNGTNAKWINYDESPILVPVGFKVEVLEPPKKTPTKIQKINSSFKEIDSKERKSMKSPISIFKINDGSNKKNIKKQIASFSNNWSVSVNDEASTSKMAKKSVELINPISDKICAPNVNMGHNNNWFIFAYIDSASKIVEKSNDPDEVEDHISLTFATTPDKSFMSPESSKSTIFEQRVMRQKPNIVSNKKPDRQIEGTPKRKVEETSASKVLQKRRKTIAREEITMLQSGGISNMALEKVQSKAFEDGF